MHPLSFLMSSLAKRSAYFAAREFGGTVRLLDPSDSRLLARALNLVCRNLGQSPWVCRLIDLLIADYTFFWIAYFLFAEVNSTSILRAPGLWYYGLLSAVKRISPNSSRLRLVGGISWNSLVGPSLFHYMSPCLTAAAFALYVSLAGWGLPMLPCGLKTECTGLLFVVGVSRSTQTRVCILVVGQLWKPSFVVPGWMFPVDWSARIRGEAKSRIVRAALKVETHIERCNSWAYN